MIFRSKWWMFLKRFLPQLANFGQGVTACNLSQNEWSKVAAEKLQNNSFLLNSNFCTCSSLQMRVWIFEWNVSLMKLHFFSKRCILDHSAWNYKSRFMSTFPYKWLNVDLYSMKYSMVGTSISFLNVQSGLAKTT